MLNITELLLHMGNSPSPISAQPGETEHFNTLWSYRTCVSRGQMCLLRVMWLSPAHLGSWGPRNQGAADLSFAATVAAGSPPAHLTWLHSLSRARSPWCGFCLSMNCNNLCVFSLFFKENLRGRPGENKGLRWPHSCPLGPHCMKNSLHSSSETHSWPRLFP